MHQQMSLNPTVNLLRHQLVTIISDAPMLINFNDAFFTHYLERRGGAAVKALASHFCGLGSIPGVTCSWVCYWFFSLLRGVFSGSSDFPPPTKPKFPISIQHGNGGQEEPPRGMSTAKSHPHIFKYQLL